MAYDPMNGETPIAGSPPTNADWGAGQWTGTGGGQKAQEFYAMQEFNKLFGRNPTQSELASLSGAYASDNPNTTNTAQGNQAIAQYFQNFSNTPDQINKANQAKYLKEAPQHFDAVNQLFQSHLGRTATQDELNHFGSLLASGTTDPYQLQQFLQQQPEYTTKQNQGFQDKLSGQLAGYDQQYFQNQILPSIQQAYAKQGRSFDSSAFQAAATGAGQQQNVQRQQYLAGLSASQYGGVQDRAYQDYANAVANQQQLTNSGINARYSGNLALTDRLNNITDYNTQSQLYNQYLSKYGKRQPDLFDYAGLALGGIQTGTNIYNARTMAKQGGSY